MKKQIKLYSDENTIYKMKYIALQTASSQTGIFEKAMDAYIAAYEAEHGEIPLPDRNPVGGGTTE